MSIAALAALAALATCDGCCARAGAAGLQAAAVHAARWGVFQSSDRLACVEALRLCVFEDAHPRLPLRGRRRTAAGGCGSCRQCLLLQLLDHGLTPSAVLPTYGRGAFSSARLDGRFLAARGVKYDVTCVCVALERPSARYAFHAGGAERERTREIERPVDGVAYALTGDRRISLTTRLRKGVDMNDGEIVDDATVTLQAAFRTPAVGQEPSRGRDKRDVYFLVTPYTPHDGEPHFPDMRLQALLRTPPPEWKRHQFADRAGDGGLALVAPESSFAGCLPGGTGSGVKVALAEFVLRGRSAIVWVFTAVKARE